MSKLSNFAWRRNGFIGRVTWAKNHLKNLKSEHGGNPMTPFEKQEISAAISHLENVLSLHKYSWKQLKLQLKKE